VPSKAKRLQEFLRRLETAPATSSADEALGLIVRILNAVEDEFSGVPFQPENWRTDGYPSNGMSESTVSTRLGFSVPSLTSALGQLRRIHATVLIEPSDTPFGRRAVVKDFEGHKVEIYERVFKAMD
jgi:hypothetical protein